MGWLRKRAENLCGIGDGAAYAEQHDMANEVEALAREFAERALAKSYRHTGADIAKAKISAAIEAADEEPLP